MNARDVGFTEELIKLGVVGGLLKSTVGTIAKHPGKALGVGFIAAPTAMAYQAAKKQGLAGGEKGRYLAAGRDASGKVRASEAAYTDYHGLFPHKPRPHAVRALSKNYKENMFSRASARPKEK